MTEQVAATPDAATDRMSAAEFRVVRESLGLTTRWVAEFLEVAERTVHRWEGGQSPIPDGVRRTMRYVEGNTADAVAAKTETCRVNPTRPLLTYRTDAEYWAEHPTRSYPASWHRALAARVAREIPGLAIDYWTP